MKKYKAKDSSGKYYVHGKGFTGSTKCEGSELTEANLGCLTDLGYTFTSEEIVEAVNAATGSFGVVYIRRKDVKDGKVAKLATDANLGEIDPSKRRFATFAEAKQHGSRFNLRKAKSGDKPGTAGHVGFYVVQTNDPVNAAVNWASGMTNSL